MIKHLDIDPAEEILKAYGIVHGYSAERIARELLGIARLKAIRQSENNQGDGI